MNFYKHHIGDYAAATAHLTFTEDAAYSRLLRIYYRDEKPLPVEVRAVQRLAGARTPDELEAVETVLREFFTLAEDGWHSKRCDEEIAKAQAQAETNRIIAEARETKRREWRERKEHESCNGSSNDSLPVREPSHKPDSTSQTPLANKEQRAKATVRQVAPCDRFDDFWRVYPNKQGKQEARKRWERDKLDGLADQIIGHVLMMAGNDDGWLRGYAPMGSTYLNQARWTDVPRGSPQQASPQPSKTMQGIMRLEAMVNGLDDAGSYAGATEARFLGAGPDAGHGRLAWNGGGVDGGFDDASGVERTARR